ncbi:MAG: serine hydrolase domain-containing protein [Oscillatoriaceae cyanobacterium]
MQLKSVMAAMLIGVGMGVGLCQPANAPPLAGNADAMNEETVSGLQEVLANAVRSQGIPGAVMYVETPQGKWLGAAGVKNLLWKQPMQVGDRFRIGSITKTFVAAVVLQLYEEKKLDLDDPISKWLSADIAAIVPNSEDITIQQLLNHTSGLPDYIDSDDFYPDYEAEPEHQWTAEEAITYIYGLETIAKPGEEFYYANTNYIILELIVQAVTGKSLAVELRQRIYEPLDLKDTFMEEKEPIPGGFVSGYDDWDGDGKRDDVTQREKWGLGDGGIISNVQDLATFARALFAEAKVIKTKTLAQMLDFFPDDEGGGYGLGVTLTETDWGEAWGHTGKTGGFLSTMIYIPAQNATVVVLTNAADKGDPDAIADDALELVLGEGL